MVKCKFLKPMERSCEVLEFEQLDKVEVDGRFAASERGVGPWGRRWYFPLDLFWVAMIKDN